MENSDILKVLSFDLSSIIQFIMKKKIDKGTFDDSSYKLKSMMKKIQAYLKKFREEGTKTENLAENSSNGFFEFLTQMYTSNEPIEHLPEKSDGDDSPVSNKRIHNFNMAKRKRSSVNKQEQNEKQNNSYPEGFSDSRLKKYSQFEMIYAYSEKDQTIEKISIEEFNLISFIFPIPNLMVDMIKYLTDYDIYKRKARVLKTPNFESFDIELAKHRRQLGPDNYKIIVDGFLKLCSNPEDVIDSHWYITQDSIHKNFK